jgi:hypothetical protein
MLFAPGFNHFKTVEEAEIAIRRVIGNAHTDGRVVKEFTDESQPVTP